MKTFRYEIKDADGTNGVIVLSEFEAQKLCASMNKDLYGTEVAMQNMNPAQSYRFARDLPQDVEFMGVHTNMKFKKIGAVMHVRDEFGDWKIDPTHWHHEDESGLYRKV